MSNQFSSSSGGKGASKGNLAQRALARFQRSQGMVSPWARDYTRSRDASNLLNVNNRQVRRVSFATAHREMPRATHRNPVGQTTSLNLVANRIEKHQTFASQMQSRYNLADETADTTSTAPGVHLVFAGERGTGEAQAQRPVRSGDESPFGGMSFSEMKQRIEERRQSATVAPDSQMDAPEPTSQPIQRAQRRSAPVDTSSLTVSRPFRPTISPKKAQADLQETGWRFKSKSSVSETPSAQTSSAMSQLVNRPGSGSEIPKHARSSAEEALGQSFKDVRIHRTNLGPLNVEAATQGEDIFLKRDNTGFDSPEDISLLGHELTHVAQSRGTTQIKPLDSMRMVPGPVIQRSVEGDEGQAAAVESSIQRSMSSGPLVVQRDMDLGDPAQLQDATQAASGNQGAQQANAMEQRLESVTQDMQDVEDLSEDVIFVDDVDIDEDLEEEEETEVNLDSLARKVYPIIRQIMSLERERLGKR